MKLIATTSAAICALVIATSHAQAEGIATRFVEESPDLSPTEVRVQYSNALERLRRKYDNITIGSIRTDGNGQISYLYRNRDGLIRIDKTMDDGRTASWVLNSGYGFTVERPVDPSNGYKIVDLNRFSSTNPRKLELAIAVPFALHSLNGDPILDFINSDGFIINTVARLDPEIDAIPIRVEWTKELSDGYDKVGNRRVMNGFFIFDTSHDWQLMLSGLRYSRDAPGMRMIEVQYRNRDDFQSIIDRVTEYSIFDSEPMTRRSVVETVVTTVSRELIALTDFQISAFGISDAVVTGVQKSTGLSYLVSINIAIGVVALVWWVVRYRRRHSAI